LIVHLRDAAGLSVQAKGARQEPAAPSLSVKSVLDSTDIVRRRRASRAGDHRSVRALAVKPAPPARRFAASGLDRSARPSKSGRHATMHCCDAVRTEAWHVIRHRPI